MAQKRHSPGSPSPHGPGALGPESRFLPQITPIRRKGRRKTPYNRLSGVLRAAGETIISEYSIFYGTLFYGTLFYGTLFYGTLFYGTLFYGTLFYGTLLPSAYTPKRWVDREARED